MRVENIEWEGEELIVVLKHEVPQESQFSTQNQKDAVQEAISPLCDGLVTHLLHFPSLLNQSSFDLLNLGSL